MQGLIAATHTPFTSNGELNLAAVERQAAHLVANQVGAVFVAGTTGECHSLTVDERLRLSDRWFDVAKGSGLKVVVHVGANCLADARALASQAKNRGAAAIGAMAPSYFRPASVDELIASCADVSAAAPGVPFYFYDIPAFTHVYLSMPDFLERGGERMPDLAGVKFTNSDLYSFQRCRHVAGGRFNMLWGFDEMLLAALVLGAHGAVGNTYNLAAPIYHRVMSALASGDLDTARAEQFRSVELVATLSKHGFLASTKAMLGFLGVDVGLPRLPVMSLTAEQLGALRNELEAKGFLNL